MSVDIKICGLRTAAAIHTAAEAGATHVGFVIFPASVRHVAYDSLSDLLREVPRHVATVAVLVSPEDRLVDDVLATGRIDAVQVHEIDDPARILALRDRTGRAVWRAQGVETRADVDTGLSFTPIADRILFDAKPARSAAGGDGVPGGTGQTFDWSLLDGVSAPGWGLSGGLTPENVADAIRRLRPGLVDVSSGVEAARGVKSLDKIAAFVAAARAGLGSV